MTRHSFRWLPALCGAGFLLVAVLWGVWSSAAVGFGDVSSIFAGTLIVGGLLGVAATLWPRGNTSDGG